MSTASIIPVRNIQQAVQAAQARSTVMASGGGNHEELTRQTQKWVAQTFYGTLLKQMRESPFHSDMFDGGKGGKAFMGLLDQHLADRMARGAGNKLVRSIVKKFEAAAAYKKSSRAKTMSGSDAHRDAKDESSRESSRAPAPRARRLTQAATHA